MADGSSRRKEGNARTRKSGKKGRSRAIGERQPPILILDDDAELLRLLSEFFEDLGYVVHPCTRADDAMASADRVRFEVALVDLTLRKTDGIEVIRKLTEISPTTVAIVITGDLRSERTMAATASGAWEVLTKPVDMPAVADAVARALVSHKQRDPSSDPSDSRRYANAMIGDSPAMRDVFQWAGRVARMDQSVLIRGETGTGKELMAKLIHAHSRRAKGPFVAINCGALPGELIESELFGHEKGAFTGATSQKRGRFEQAHNGSLLLDEIGEMPAGAQTKLLRALEERCIDRIGGTRPIPVDVRIIAATHSDLEALIETRRFRSDLFYRLNVMPLTLPPLREREEDILLLVEFFLHQNATDGGRIPEIEDEAVGMLRTYTWPGNVRELRNVIQRALALAPAGRITASHISQCLPDVAAPPAGQDPWTAYLDATLHAADQGTLTKAHAEVMKEAQRQLFRLALQRTHGNKTAASRLLGITRPYFTERASQLGIRP